MDSLIPIIVIVYLVSSVVGAVIKAVKNAGKQPARPQNTVKPQIDTPTESPHVEPEEIFQPDKQITEPAHSLIDQQDTNVDDDFTDDFSVEEELQRPTSVDRLTIRLTSNKFREGVVLSELLREPRSHRPWPNR